MAHSRHLDQVVVEAVGARFLMASAEELEHHQRVAAEEEVEVVLLLKTLEVELRVGPSLAEAEGAVQ